MIKQIFIFGIVFTATLAVSELFIRSSRLASVSTTEFYPERGRGKRPNLDYLIFNEGFGIGSYNEYTYLGEGIGKEKNSNTVRIALMGDSFIEAWQVFERHQFGNIAQDILSKRFPDKKIEILNFGHSNLDLADQYGYFKLFAETFNADYTLFLLAPYNLEPRYWDKLRPQTVIENDSLIFKKEYPEAAVSIYNKTKVLTQNFSLLHMLNSSRKKLGEQPLGAILFDKAYTWIYPPKVTSLKKVEEEKFEMHPVATKILESVNPEEVIFISRHIDPLPNDFKEACLENGLRYWDLTPVLETMITDGLDPYEWKVTNKSGHWNHKAHEYIGKDLAERLSQLIRKEH